MNTIIDCLSILAGGRRRAKAFSSRQGLIKFYGFRPLIVLGLAWVFAMITPVHGAILNVDTTTDDATLTACDDATPNDCSLRGAILNRT